MTHETSNNKYIYLTPTSKGRFAVAHHDSCVGSDGTEDMFGDKEDNLDNSCLTLSTRLVGEYMSQTQDGKGDVT